MNTTTMKIRKLHSKIPFKTLFLLLLSIAGTVQLIIISYNHFIGFYTIQSLVEAVERFIWGTFLSLIAAFFLAYPDLFFIRQLNKKYPWKQKAISRSFIQLFVAVSTGTVISIIITTLAHILNPYEEDLLTTYVFNGIVISICNIILMIIFEAWIFFIAEYEQEKKNQELMKELTEIRFEVLKNQMNPHFMFNSLNVLSGLIKRDPEKSQQFIEEFSNIYRYVLDTIDHQVVTLEQELKFSRSYFYLQQIRYGKALSYHFSIRSQLLSWYLPPLSLQVVLENAIKHNQISAENPLDIDIKSTEHDNSILVSNNLQPKISFGKSTGLGQKNLKKRYKMVSSRAPEFNVGTNEYRVILPLIKE